MLLLLELQLGAYQRCPGFRESGIPQGWRAYVRAWVCASVGAWVPACGRAGAHGCVGGCVHVGVPARASYLHSLEFSVWEDGMKALIWEVSMAAAYITSKTTTALRDAILESWRGTLTEGYRTVIDCCAPLWGKPGF